MKLKKVILIAILIAIVIVGVFIITTAKKGSSENGSKYQSSDVAKNVDEKVIEVKEDMFIAQTSDMYLNMKDYKGKKVKLEGFVDVAEYEGKDHYGVIRKTPGCCGNDGTAGFEFTYDKEMPKKDDWVEVTGTFDIERDIDGYDYLIIKADTVVVKTERGADFVTN